MRYTTCATQKLITKYQNLFFKISWAKKAVKFKFLHIKGFEIGIFLIFPNFCPQNLQKRFSYFLFMLRQLVIFAFVRWYFYVLEFLWLCHSWGDYSQFKTNQQTLSRLQWTRDNVFRDAIEAWYKESILIEKGLSIPQNPFLSKLFHLARSCLQTSACCSTKYAQFIPPSPKRGAFVTNF